MKKVLSFLAISIVLLVIGFFVWPRMQGDQSTEETSPTPTNSQLMERVGEFSVQSSDVNYYGETTGYYAYPEEEGSYPGVVMIHEWWGLNDNIKDMADKLASEGYRVLAVDLYNGQIAEDSTEARELTSGLDQEEALSNMQAAMDHLRLEGSEKIASLGWCFGGGQSMQLSLSENLDATVIYYGNLVTDQDELAGINWPVLGVFGEEDQSIPVTSVREFEESLNNLGVVNEIYVYPGVGHAFANPTGQGYAHEETMDAWEKTLAFLETNLQN